MTDVNPHDPLGFQWARLCDQLAALAGWVTAVSDHWDALDDKTRLLHLNGIADHVDAATAVTPTVSDAKYQWSVHEVRNTLHVLKMSLWLLLKDWTMLSDEDRRQLLESASSIVRSRLALSPHEVSSPGTRV